ncbi:MAG: tetratricopeptide repeat protein, partial [Chloroflexi bacterium]|nr:tetratricopeptide repeat protein [Chloroflexota bacterium]
GDADFAARVAARLEQQQAAYYARVGGPKRTAPAEVEAHQAQPESWQERVERQPVQAERGSTYTVISASQCAIGDNAMVINNIGRLPLRWKRPAEGRPLLARAAVGRETELAELHGRLTSTQGVALVARGTSAAVRGQSGIGKTTLAAMYAERYGAQYPGGVLWLDVGPGRRTPDLVAPILQRIATYAYDADLQANALLENAEFAADAVKALLDGHGALLVIIDDVWSTAALRALREALPEDACTLLTTRDYDVAYALENSPAAIQTLDVLAPPDARLLLQQGAPGLPDDLADTVARGLGYHAQALTLAAGALASRKPHNYARTAAELLRRVAAGEGFGDLPRLDKTDQVTAVEIALKYSYDYLGESSPPAPAQFRALGAFAPEADFDLAAVAAMWNLDAALAEEFLLLLDGLGLLQETVPGARWQQHVILRAYALSLQTARERIQFSERHADHYIALAQACYESKPRKYDRVEQEFLQIQHAFDWCQENSPRRATRLALLLDDFMRNRGRAATLHQWLQTAMQGADLHGDRLGKANTLKSLGDLERRLGHLEQARAHYDAALPLYEAEQDRLGKANTLKSLGDLESRLGHLEQARAHYDAALPLYEAEQEPTGKLNTWISLARLEAALGRQAEADHYYQRAFRLAEDIGFGDHPVVRDWKEEYARFTAGQTGQPPMDEASVMQQMADLLIAWIQTPDWSASEAFAQEHAADLLTDEAEAVLELLRQGNPDHRAIPQHQTLLRRCREVGIEAAYHELRAALSAARQMAQDPANAALAALLQVNSGETFEQALAQHPTLLELATLERLAARVAETAPAQPDMAGYLLACLGLLLEHYNHRHAEQVDLSEQTRFATLCESLLPVADALDEDLAAGLRHLLGWALNTLGNAHAEQDDHVAAVETYTRAITYAPENAMLYRNRASEYLKMAQVDQAAADIERAAALEPDAPRLVQLRTTLATQTLSLEDNHE